MNDKTIIIGADTTSPLAAHVPGYGTMRLTGEGFYGEPKDRSRAIALLRKAVELGVNFFDTADFYGPGVTNQLLSEALHPYPADLIIATKVGTKRGSDKSWLPFGQPEELRASVENNLRGLKLEQLHLVHYGKAANGPGTYQAGLETLFDLQREGKILHVGLTNATPEQFETASAMGKVASVENMYSYSQRVTDLSSPHGFQGGEMLPICEQHQIPFIPFFSLQTTLLTERHPGRDKMKELANTKGVTVAQLNIAWLLHRSAWVLPIPGTTSIPHLEENIRAINISLTLEELTFLG